MRCGLRIFSRRRLADALTSTRESRSKNETGDAMTKLKDLTDRFMEDPGFRDENVRGQANGQTRGHAIFDAIVGRLTYETLAS